MVEVEVTFDYAAEQEDELNIKVGNIIKNVTMSEGGWWEGELNGKVGMFPDNFVKVIEKAKPAKVKEEPPRAARTGINHKGASVRELASRIKDDVHVGMGAPKKKESQPNVKRKKAKVVFSYEPENEDELKLEVGNIVEILKQEEEGWWEGSLNGKVGMFPSNFVEEIDETEPEKTPEEKPKEAPVEGKKKVIGGVGLGNIFEGGPIKLKNTSIKNTDKVSHPPPEPVVKHTEEDTKAHIVTKREKPVERAVVRYSYTADNEDELTLKEGEIITVLDRELEDAGWWKGEVNGRVGVFPDNFVEDLPPEESESISKPSSVHHNNFPPQPRPKKPPPPGSTKQAPKLPEKAPVSDTAKHDKHDKPLPPEPAVEKAKKKEDPPEKHHPPAISSKKPSVPPPVGRKPVQTKPVPAEPKTQREEPKVMHIKEEKKETPSDSFDNVETSDRLTHLTANRAKGPSKRPPSQKQKNHMRIWQQDEQKVNGDIQPVKEVKEPPKRPPLTREMKEESPPAKPQHAPARPPEPNPGNAMLLSAIEELKKEVRELRATCASKSVVDELRSENEKLRTEVEHMRNRQSRQIKDLMAEVDEEKKIRLNTQVEVERIRKLLTESHV